MLVSFLFDYSFFFIHHVILSVWIDETVGFFTCVSLCVSLSPFSFGTIERGKSVITNLLINDVMRTSVLSMLE